MRDQLQKLPLDQQIHVSLKEFGKPVGGQNDIFTRMLREQIKASEPISFVGFWGIGNKETLDEKDCRFMNMLNDLQQQVQQQYESGAHMTIILADMHGVFNGEILQRENGKGDPKAGVVARYRRRYGNVHAPYLAKVENELQQRGIQTVWLSDVYTNYGLEIPNIHLPIEADSSAYHVFMEREQRRHESYIWSARHNRRGVPAEQAAFHYIRERLQEKQMLVDMFPHHIFFVNGGRNLALRIVPEGQMPILYLNEGPVWFMEGGETHE